MSVHPHNDRVAALLREVAREVVMPRFCTLATHEIVEKTPGELVTIADHEAELRIEEGLAKIEAVRIVGEEASEVDPSILDDLKTGDLWLVDPIDGTANYAAGRTPFGLMVALVQHGVTLAGWLYDPVRDRLCHARLGHGAYIDGVRISARTTGAVRPIASLATWFMDTDDRHATETRAKQAYELVPIPRCAAEHYPRLCLGDYDVSMFKRTLPWDHAPGALFVNEAGGRVAHWDGQDYEVSGMTRGVLATSSPKLWDEAARILLG